MRSLLATLREKKLLRWSVASVASALLHAGLAFGLILYKPAPRPPEPKKVHFRLCYALIGSA